MSNIAADAQVQQQQINYMEHSKVANLLIFCLRILVIGLFALIVGWSWFWRRVFQVC